MAIEQNVKILAAPSGSSSIVIKSDVQEQFNVLTNSADRPVGPYGRFCLKIATKLRKRTIQISMDM